MHSGASSCPPPPPCHRNFTVALTLTVPCRILLVVADVRQSRETERACLVDPEVVYEHRPREGATDGNFAFRLGRISFQAHESQAASLRHIMSGRASYVVQPAQYTYQSTHQLRGPSVKRKRGHFEEKVAGREGNELPLHRLIKGIHTCKLKPARWMAVYLRLE